VVERHLQGQGLTRYRVLAAAVRLIDLGFFRPGGEEHAAENGSFGLATIRREHVTCGRCELSFEYTGKSGKHREQDAAGGDFTAASAHPRDRNDREGLWRISLDAVDGWTLGAAVEETQGDRGPFARLLGT
jgi:DNA topoisomerase IB